MPNRLGWHELDNSSAKSEVGQGQHKEKHTQRIHKQKRHDCPLRPLVYGINIGGAEDDDEGQSPKLADDRPGSQIAGYFSPVCYSQQSYDCGA